MRNGKIASTGVLAAMLLLGGIASCGRGSSGGADDAADKLGRSLDPAPEYVDKPAQQPDKPQ
jgi:hypothetical protein